MGLVEVRWTAKSKYRSNSPLFFADQYRTVSTVPVFFLLFLLAGCGGGSDAEPVPDEPVACSTHQAFFTDVVWPVLDAKCMVCHEQNITTNDLALLASGYSYSIANFQTVQSVAKKLDASGRSLLITKSADLNSSHGGGSILATDSQEYKTISELISKLSSCTGTTIPATAIQSLSGYHRLRKLTLSLAGRLPTNVEEQRIDNATSLVQQEIEFAAILDSVMTEVYFFERVKNMFNDRLLLDSQDTVYDLTFFPDRDIFNNQLQSSYTAAEAALIRRKYRYGLTQAPLELITHVVRENRPFTEVLTANYVMVNAYTATLYAADVGDPAFNFVLGDAADKTDGIDFLEAIIFDEKARQVPHAGVITSLSFLGRYPSTNTNKNRARSRYVYLYFLDTDVEALATRGGLDLENADNINGPFNDQNCKVCHDTVDPIAGLFKNRQNLGAYNGNNQNWYNERIPQTMLEPGYGRNSAIPLPAARSANALQWLAERIVEDNAFAVSMVKIVFKGLTGQNLEQDIDTLELYKTHFIESGFNLKSLVSKIVNGPYFLTSNASVDANIDQVSHLGMGKLLTPRQLNQKIKALTDGYVWAAPKSRDTLLDIGTYRLLYGGIDSKIVTTRTTDPTSLMIGVQDRIANQTACKMVPTDFNKTTDRTMFPLVEITDTPDTIQGAMRIKQNIVYLHKHFLGELISADDEVVERTYRLYTDVRSLTQGQQLPTNCRGGLAATNPVYIDADRSVRPWMAVITYLMSNFRFLYE